jgi:thiamine-phosphate diphosphorylase
LISVLSCCWDFLLLAASLVLLSFECHGWKYGCHFVRLQNFPRISARSTKTFIANAHQDDVESDSLVFPAMKHRPLLAVVTAPNACETEETMERSFEAIRQSVQTQHVDLVSIRLSINDGDGKNESCKQRAVTLTRRLVELSKGRSCGPMTTPALSSLPIFKVVCSSDLVPVAVEAEAHGVHVKERHLPILADIVAHFDYPIVIGTSIHSLKPYSNDSIQPHYYFVGTCYMTASHPEKMSISDLEGPQLPGKFKELLKRTSISKPVFAIGGIDDSNCHEPVAFGADGVAVIRAVVEADDPAKAVMRLQDKMQEGLERRHES